MRSLVPVEALEDQSTNLILIIARGKREKIGDEILRQIDARNDHYFRYIVARIRFRTPDILIDRGPKRPQ
jgi:hypothetical protein